MAELPTQYVAVSIIFFLSGLMLKTGRSPRRPRRVEGDILGVCFDSLRHALSGRSNRVSAPDGARFPIRSGTVSAACQTTLTSGVALTAQARGNVALALLLTVLTNIVGIFTGTLHVSAPSEFLRPD